MHNAFTFLFSFLESSRITASTNWVLIQEHIILSSFISKVDYTAKYVCHFAVDIYHSLKTFRIVNWWMVLNHTMLNLRWYNKIIWHWFWCGQETCRSIGTFSCFRRSRLGFKCPLPIVTIELKHTHTHILWNAYGTGSWILYLEL